MRTDSDMRILPLYHAPCLLPDACLSNVFHQTRFVKDSRSFHSDFLWNYHCVERYTLQDEAYRAVTMVGLYWIFMVAFTQRVIRNHLLIHRNETIIIIVIYLNKKLMNLWI